MSILIGHASISESGGINGAKGDSTGKEVCTRTWYSKPWDYMAIHPNATVREKHAAAVEAACANDNIGYGQNDRNTLNTQAKAVAYNLSKVGKCNCDCSSLQNVAAVASGASGVTYGSNGWTTSTMKAALKAAGYKIVEDSTYLTSQNYCVRGAIYVKAGSHTVCGLTNGSKASQTLSKAGITSSGTATTSTTTSVSASKKTATDSAKSKDSSLAGTYKTTANLNMRNGAGTSKSVMVTLPKGTSVKNYGYYTKTNGVKWLYVQVTYNSVTYTGFCSKQYLNKQ
ncbi:MAG: hypothetical protein LUH14_10480 [Clostridiaceae bacterium]|nr:hypothetical protein [Clostridiaceae bacterium]